MHERIAGTKTNNRNTHTFLHYLLVPVIKHFVGQERSTHDFLLRIIAFLLKRSFTMTNPDEQRIYEQKMRERKEEQKLFQRFQNVATLKLEQISRKVQATKQQGKPSDGNGFGIDTNAGPDQQQDYDELTMGDEEQRIISRMAGMGLKEGILASLASFIILRRGPKYIGRWVQRRQQRQQSSSSSPFSSSTSARSNASYQLSDPKKLTNSSINTNNPFQMAATNASQREFSPRPRGFFSRSIWFVFDTVLALMVGANVSVVYTDKHAIRQQIAEIPLVSGRSLTADALCDEVVQELKTVRDEKNPTYERLNKMNRNQNNKTTTNSETTETTPASFFMEGIVLFCQNCERRRYLEKHIREESGLDPTVPVEIPIPGVPRDGLRLIVGENDDGIENNNSFLEQFDHQDDTSWTNDFGSDNNNNGYDGDQGRSM